MNIADILPYLKHIQLFFFLILTQLTFQIRISSKLNVNNHLHCSFFRVHGVHVQVCKIHISVVTAAPLVAEYQTKINSRIESALGEDVN